MNEDLKKKCQPIDEYSIFSNAYKYFRRQGMKIDHAVDAAIHHCLKHNVMTDYLRNNQKEVVDMFGFEWNEREERGRTEATTLNIKNLMKSMHLSPEDAMKALGIAPSEFSRYLALL